MHLLVFNPFALFMGLQVVERPKTGNNATRSKLTPCHIGWMRGT